MSVPSAEALAHMTGYPILDVPIDQDLARCCGSESKFWAGVLKSFAKLEQKQVATPQDMSADESALLMKYKQSTTPIIIRVKCAHRSEEAFIVGIRARKSKGKTDLLQYRPGQQMTPEQKAEFDTWDAEKQAAYSKCLTEDDFISNQKFSNRHRSTCNKVIIRIRITARPDDSERQVGISSRIRFVLCLAIQVVSHPSVTPSAASSSVVHNSFDHMLGEAKGGSKKRKELFDAVSMVSLS